MGKQFDMIETGVVQDTFVSGLGEVESIGHGLLRFTYYTYEHGDRVIVAKLIATQEALIDALKLAGQVAGLSDVAEGAREASLN